MGIFVRDVETEKSIRKLAKLRGTTLVDAIRGAVEKDLASPDLVTDEDKVIQAVIDDFSALPRSGLKADKAFFDSLYED